MKRNALKKILVGTVASDKMDKVVTVEVHLRRIHPLYKKSMIGYKKYKARDARNEAKEGDVVRIMEMRPSSKETRWRLAEIVKKAQRS